MSNKVLDSGMKGATKGELIGSRFGPQGIVIGATIGGIVGFIFDD
ncbi:hypothetical protein [Cognaticolwellia beringensis]|nr:hypothetical protein [Cognaticolwellia beringensis]